MSAADGGPLYDVSLVGAGGEYMDSAVLVEWVAKPGASIEEGQVLAVVETAKAATEVTAPTAGIVHELLAKPGEEIKVGAVLARIATGAVVTEAAASVDLPGAAQAQPPVPGDISGLARRLPKVFASPLAKRIARDRGIALTGVKGSGPGGRICRADVEGLLASSVARLAAPRSSPSVGEGYRRAMANHMAHAGAIPAFTVGMDIDGGKLLEMRASIKQQGGRATLNDLIITAVARTLRHHPRVNAQWDGKGVLFNGEINIGVAVATDLGLVVPVVHRADSMDPESVAQHMAELRVKAQSQRLSPADVSGGTFSISNLGSFGVTAFMAALSPPAAAILAVPAFRNVTLFEGGRLETRPLAHFSVTADHRVLDGVDVARFLRDLKNALEGGTVFRG